MNLLLVSTGKSTILSEFPNLESKYIYPHLNSELTDFQFSAQKNVFVEVNKKSGIEIMRVKNHENEKSELQRVRKLTMNTVYCVACAKKSPEEFALGQYNGTVKIYNMKSGEFVKNFSDENSRNKRQSVISVDYNASDEYISSVYESGLINIFGTKTNAKIEAVIIDGSSTLARFHPTKRFHMAIASHKGPVSLYDIHAKKKNFHSSNSHTAPCRDLCMSPAASNTLISVGYDCIMNIFDTRRKTQPLQLHHNHPLSSVTLSDCGKFCCVGNLKGEIITYDMRKLKYALCCKQVHNGAVNRIGFVPIDSETVRYFCNNEDINVGFAQTSPSAATIDQTFIDTESQVVDVESHQPVAGNVGQEKRRDSFADYLDFQANKGLEKVASRIVKCRESNDFWDAIHCRSITTRRGDYRGSGASALQKPSSSANNSVASALQKSSSSANNSGASDLQKSSSSANNSGASALQKSSSSADNSAASTESKTLGKKEKEKKRNSMKVLLNQDSTGRGPLPLRQQQLVEFVLSPRPKLVEIQEEQPKQNNSSGSDKENPPLDFELLNRLHKLPADRNSTPNRIEGRSSSYPLKPDANQNSSLASIAELRTEINLRFQQLESEMKFQLETNKWQIFTQNFNLWNNQNRKNDEISDALRILLQTDPFVTEFLRLRQENEDLRMQLSNIMKK